MALTHVKVFVLEDDAVTRQSLERKIRSAPGFNVEGSAGTLKTARERLLTLRPDILLVDLQLPDGDGADLIANEAIEQVILNGEARAYGLEFMFKKNEGNLISAPFFKLNISKPSISLQ